MTKSLRELSVYDNTVKKSSRSLRSVDYCQAIREAVLYAVLVRKRTLLSYVKDVRKLLKLRVSPFCSYPFLMITQSS